MPIGHKNISNQPKGAHKWHRNDHSETPVFASFTHCLLVLSVTNTALHYLYIDNKVTQAYKPIKQGVLAIIIVATVEELRVDEWQYPP